MQIAMIALMTLVQGASPLQPAVQVEEDVYAYQSPDNGSGPMWCHGSTCLVRVGNDVFASGIETLKDLKPLNNVRWMLFARGEEGWRRLRVDEEGRTREPCPMATFADGRFFLSINPTLTPPNTYNGPAKPEILEFSASNLKASPKMLHPAWDGEPKFTEHSYRSFAADGPSGELLLLQNIDYTHAEWTFRDHEGKWSAQGKLVWPFGKEYGHPKPVRLCYPNVALKDRAVYFCGVSDVTEPNEAWQKYKKEITGQNWDYDFRRLFFGWCPDITKGKFQPWLEIASRDKTCGWISPLDLWVGPDGRVHILWSERALDERLRKKFFPDQKQSYALNYAILRDGKVIDRKSLVLAEEGGSKEIPGHARFQVTPDNRLFVFYYVSGTSANGKGISENRLMELRSDGSIAGPVRVDLKHPMNSFFTATWRGGSAPSNILDLFGNRADGGAKMSYARVRILK